MTEGQKRAIRELERLRAVDPDVLEVKGTPQLIEDWLRVSVSIRLGLMETKPGGLEFKAIEDFELLIPPDFPFEHPLLLVKHKRFAGFPHVNWTRHICLYQSNVEWNPTDGIFGFLDRLTIWINRAAINDMDPIEGPLHPPAYVIEWSLTPFVIRANTPVKAGESWVGLAELEKRSNRIELTGWNDGSQEWPEGHQPALAVVLPKPLPIEFPENGKGFFGELNKQGVDKENVLAYLRISAKLTPTDEPAFLILAMPMRRSPEGQAKHHIMIWAIDPKDAEYLRSASSSDEDTDRISIIKNKMNELLYRILEETSIKWCPIMEDRSEIVVRRDFGSPVAWFAGKRILILGCGALGSWAAEIMGRSQPNLLHLVDNSFVKPGLLARQNYRLNDIGSNKAHALAERIRTIMPAGSIQSFAQDAHAFIMQNVNGLKNYDVILDCTASHIFQMKLEKAWRSLGRCTPPFISIVIDAKAQRSLCVVVERNSKGGVWDAYIRLKHRLSLDERHKDIISAFYSERALKDLFQPEPGCSDPTFVGSTADISILVSTSLNTSSSQIATNMAPVGIAFSAHGLDDRPGVFDILKLSSFEEIQVNRYAVRISSSLFRDVRAWIQKNNRIRSSRDETGGILWGLWDDVVDTIWIFDASGPPPDSLHDPGHFIFGIAGTIDEHKRRIKQSRGTCGFVGFWHTHPFMPSQQSSDDLRSMAGLVSNMGQNQRRAIMLIFGRERGVSTSGIYVYESQSLASTNEFISVGTGQITVGIPD